MYTYGELSGTESAIPRCKDWPVTSLITAAGVIYLATASASRSIVLMRFRASTSACSPGRSLWLSSQNLGLSASNFTSHSNKQHLWKIGRPFVTNVFHFCCFVYLYGTLVLFAFWFALGFGRPKPEKATNLLLVEVRGRDVGLNGRWTCVLFWPMLFSVKEYLPF